MVQLSMTKLICFCFAFLLVNILQYFYLNKIDFKANFGLYLIDLLSLVSFAWGCTSYHKITTTKMFEQMLLTRPQMVGWWMIRRYNVILSRSEKQEYSDRCTSQEELKVVQCI